MIIVFILFSSLFSNYHSSISDKLLIYISPNLTKNVHTDLKDILYGFESFLKYAHLHKFTVNIYLSKKIFECNCPWEISSFVCELDRTIAAITSAYFRVNPGLNISIILCEEDKFNLEEIKFHEHVDNIYQNLNNNIINFDEREKLFKKYCLFNYENINNYTKKHTFKKINLKKYDKIKILNINLPELKIDQKRVLITGGSGFIGSYIVENFLNEGHQVIVLDNNFCSDFKNIEHLISNNNLCFINWDITKNYTINDKLTDVLHFASIPSPEFYYKHPLETLRTGLIGTEYAYNLAKKHKSKFLFASTSEFYGDPDVNPQPEYYRGNVSCIGKRSQYDQSKRFAEAYLNYFAKLDEVDVRIVRIFNTYGPRMLLNDGRIVTNFLKSFFSNNLFYIHGSGNQTRSFCYVMDLVDGILRLFNYNFEDRSTVKDKTFNIGNQTELSINDSVKIMNQVIFKNLNQECSIEIIDPIDLDDPKQRRPDLTRAEKILGYSPKINFITGFEMIFKYYLNI